MSKQDKASAFFPFPFNFADTVSALKHTGLGLQRAVLKQERDRFLNSLLGRKFENFSIEKCSSAPCHTCGFSTALVTFDNGWQMETCSAFGLHDITDNGRVLVWLKNLTNQYSYNRDQEKV